jgi:hypothetical protein
VLQVALAPPPVTFARSRRQSFSEFKSTSSHTTVIFLTKSVIFVYVTDSDDYSTHAILSSKIIGFPLLHSARYVYITTLHYLINIHNLNHVTWQANQRGIIPSAVRLCLLSVFMWLTRVAWKVTQRCTRFGAMVL